MASVIEGARRSLDPYVGGRVVYPNGIGSLAVRSNVGSRRVAPTEGETKEGVIGTGGGESKPSSLPIQVGQNQQQSYMNKMAQIVGGKL
jgi:hypothetical protein